MGEVEGSAPSRVPDEDYGVRLRGRGRKKKAGDQEQAIRCDKFDKRVFREIKEQSEKLSSQQDRHAAKLPTFQEFHQDVFDGLYKYTPDQIEARRMKPGFEANHDIAGRMLGENIYKELRAHTVLDEFGAAIATEVLTDHLVTFLPEVKKMPKRGKKDNPKDRSPDEKKLQRAMQDAMREAAQEANDMNQATTCWGSDAGIAHKLPFKEKVALAQRIRRSQILRKLAKLVGRFKNLALSSQRTKISKGNEEVYSVEVGDRLDRMLPQELFNVCDPMMEIDLFKRIASREILQYSLRDRKKQTKGPIVCAIDNSGSMSGDREVWSKAVALGLLEICNVQKRKFVGIHFSHSTNIKCFEFDHGKYGTGQVLDFVEWFYGGGTDFERPLDMAADKVDENPRADIIMITDGECDVEDKWLRNWLAWRDEMEVTCYGVLIEPYYYRSEGDHGVMNKFCNGGVVDAKDIMDEDKQGSAASFLFESM